MIFRRAVAATLSLALLLPAPLMAQSRNLLEYPSIHSPTVGTRGMVVSQNAIASEVGAQVLRDGGNAVDAAIAIGFALAVTLPRAGNLGGDGFMTVYDAKSGQVHTLDFRGVAPAAATPAMFVDTKGKERREASYGYLAPSVPGTVAGLDMAHRKWGKLPWERLVAPAIKLAGEGVKLSADEAFVFSWGKERLSKSRSGQAVFYKADGTLYAKDELLKQPDLAWTLGEIAKHRADGFYKGPVAKRIAADMKAHGGLITEADLAAYKAIERAPLVGSYRGHTIYTMPPASAGGATLLNILNQLEHFDLKAMGPNSAASLHIMAEAMKLGYADRYRALGDPGFVTAPVKGFTSKAYAAERAKLIDPKKAKPMREMPVGDPLAFESPSTTHFSVADKDGNVVSTTYTLGSDFGSGVMAAGTGVLLNNQMNNYSHEQAWEAQRDGTPPPLNALAPGKRMLSTMMPTIVMKEGKPWLVTGTPGGSTIITSVVQVIVNTVDHGLNVAEATHQPRIYQGNVDTLRVEPNFSPDTVAALKAMGHPVTSDETMGSAQSIMIENGLFLGAADPRRPGALAVEP
ncbi:MULTISPECIES: gamma-glutamyltransferase [unclassified Sphingopyxis]|uniref:gamma-glutamyltransferase n=1 Tax=unclassified Sphingopyxis TaxID=2614943 RepID=UPI000736500E|nr:MULTISPECIES: gamma-glutamyltransferase [unclassified Sphingopyxis]KTE30941.1 gamma-glutamyltransferase [Sphingopyxis sp. HIX]KTE80711.1 gamma-glutamyltransferase [Sphingopyxis sp. HXXIV]